MSDQPSLQGPGPSRKFLPEVKPLESRLLLSRQVSFPDGTSFIFRTFLRLPRTGGVSEQSGTILGIGVGQPTTNTVQVTETARGVSRPNGMVVPSTRSPASGQASSRPRDPGAIRSRST